MLLVVDVGNTTTQFGIFNGDEYLGSFSCITKESRTSDELAVFLDRSLAFKQLRISDITEIIMSSVVPDVNFIMTGTFNRYFNLEPLMVGPGIKTGINIRTDNPKEVGADRIVDIVSAYTIYGGPAIVANYGTATRFDYVSEEGNFCAAITCPGIQISADALWNKAAKLPKIEILKPDSIFATTTTTSMQAGLVYGYLGLTEYIIAQIKKETGRQDTKVIACGGYSKLLKDHTDAFDIYDPDLSIKGLKIINDKNRR